MSVEPTPCENTLKTGEDRVPSIDGPWVGSQPAPRELGASTRASMTITGCGSSSITSISYVIGFAWFFGLTRRGRCALATSDQTTRHRPRVFAVLERYLARVDRHSIAFRRLD